jgi:hypothetical protein
MRKLDADLGEADALYESDEMSESPFAVIRVEAGAARRNSAYRFDAGGLDHHKSWTRGGEATDMLEAPILRRAIKGAILAHR